MEFVLRDIVGSSDFGRTEKLAWEYALIFDEVRMTAAFQKFGLRVYVEKEDVRDADKAAEAVNELTAALASAMPLLRATVLSTIADEQVALGQININNHFPALAREYEHFQQLSKDSARAAESAEPIREIIDGPIPGHSVRFPAIQLKEQAEFEARASINAFFSMLEHLLLIAFMLSGKDASNGHLAAFLGSGWNAKFKTMVDLNDNDSNQTYERLVLLHRDLRNRAIHGEVGADGTDFHFLLPGVGPVASRLVTSEGKARTYRWSGPKAEKPLEILCNADLWLRSGPLAAAVAYGESGLPLSFATELRSEITAAAAEGMESLEEMILRISRMADDAANMDW